jgi:histidinol-phosphatase (PHP family)
MTWANYHTHCHFCDGKGTPGEFAAAALARGMTALGFSSHATLPFPTKWHLPAGRLDAYCAAVRAVAAEYRGRLDVRMGFEADYLPGLMAPDAAFLLERRPDYVIGSVHYGDAFGDGGPATKAPGGVGVSDAHQGDASTRGQLGEAAYWTIDYSPEAFADGVQRIYGGEVRQAVTRYYGLVAAMVERHRLDVVGHLDLVKKFNAGGRFFDELAPWYRDAVFTALDAVAAAGVVLEVNTAAVARGFSPDPYPSYWILRRAKELGIPLTLNADAHAPEMLTASFEEVAGALAEIGFRDLRILGEGGWEAVPFTARGLEVTGR